MLSRRAAAVIAAAVLALLLVHAARSGCDHDEVEHLHAAWLVSQGDVPYRDFLEQHHPALYYLLAPLARALDPSPRALVLAARALQVALLAVLLAVFMALSRHLLRDRRELWPLALLAGCFLFLRNSMEVRPDPWMNALCLAALWQWATYLRRGRVWHAAAAGLCLGVAVAFLQKAVAFAGLLAAGTAVLVALRRDLAGRALRGSTVCAAAAALPLGALALAVTRAGLWDDFTFWNYAFNRFFYLEMPLRGPSALATVAVQIAEQPLLWIAGAAGLVLALRRGRAAADEPEVVLAATVVVGIVASLFQSRWPFGHNLLLMQPALALLAVPALDALELPRARAALGALALLLIGKVAVLCFVYDEGHGNFAVQERILAATAPAERVAVAPPFHPIFRRDAFYFWYVPVHVAAAYEAYCRRAPCPPGKLERDQLTWATRPPRLVHVPPDEPAWAPVAFGPHRDEYRPTGVPGLLQRTDAARTAAAP